MVQAARFALQRYRHTFVFSRISQILRLTFSSIFIFYRKMANGDRIINYNRRLFGPGPVARMPASGIRGYYARMPPLQGFCMAAAHGVGLGFAVALYYKFTMGNPDTAAITQYYIENPPR